MLAGGSETRTWFAADGWSALHEQEQDQEREERLTMIREVRDMASEVVNTLRHPPRMRSNGRSYNQAAPAEARQRPAALPAWIELVLAAGRGYTGAAIPRP